MSGQPRPPDSRHPLAPHLYGGKARFIADAMLGSLSRKLRALGFDTAYFRSGEDTALIELAGAEGRVILTSDRELALRARGRGLSVILTRGSDDPTRIASLAEAAFELGIALVRGPPLCSICGGGLETVPNSAVAGRVPRTVGARHRLFFRCSCCGHLYWRGSHWKKLRSLARRLGQNRVDCEPRRRKESGGPSARHPRSTREARKAVEARRRRRSPGGKTRGVRHVERRGGRGETPQGVHRLS